MAVVVLDAGVIIALLDRNDAHHKAAREALAERSLNGAELLLPASAYAETLVGPFRNDEARVSIVDELLDAVPIVVRSIDRPVARHAARLRATHAARLRIPDALVVAAALDAQADEVLTTDGRWPELPVPVTTLS